MHCDCGIVLLWLSHLFDQATQAAIADEGASRLTELGRGQALWRELSFLTWQDLQWALPSRLCSGYIPNPRL